MIEVVVGEKNGKFHVLTSGTKGLAKEVFDSPLDALREAARIFQREAIDYERTGDRRRFDWKF